MNNYDCIIIGAGFSGLAAGIRLAHFGQKVCIIEKHSRTGGLNSYYERGRFEFETGLHAMTNFVKADAPKSSHLLRLLRYLRIPYDALELREQNYSLIKFPSKSLRFSNTFAEFENSIAENFPDSIDDFRRFNKALEDSEDFDFNSKYAPALPFIRNYLRDPLLTDMIRTPVMYYGCAGENDIDLTLFKILYKSVFHQGLARPAKNGIRSIIDLLLKRFEEAGGELRLNTEITKIKADGKKVTSLITKDGHELKADKVLSSAGYIETMRLFEHAHFHAHPGKISFIETIAVMGEKFPENIDSTIVFFNDSPALEYKVPETAINNHSGIICFPHNFKFTDADKKPEKNLRISLAANPAVWLGFTKDDYKNLKTESQHAALTKAGELINFPNIEQNASFIDTFTPLTIERYTGHINGAIYGTPDKVKDGRTDFENLFICGTDQGLLGISGSMLSGINMAGFYLTK